MAAFDWSTNSTEVHGTLPTGLPDTDWTIVVLAEPDSAGQSSAGAFVSIANPGGSVRHEMRYSSASLWRGLAGYATLAASTPIPNNTSWSLGLAQMFVAEHDATANNITLFHGWQGDGDGSVADVSGTKVAGTGAFQTDGTVVWIGNSSSGGRTFDGGILLVGIVPWKMSVGELYQLCEWHDLGVLWARGDPILCAVGDTASGFVDLGPSHVAFTTTGVTPTFSETRIGGLAWFQPTVERNVDFSATIAAQNIVPSGVGFPLAYGGPTIPPPNAPLNLAGVAFPVGYGGPTLIRNQVVNPTGVAFPLAYGSPTPIPGATAIVPVGQAYPVGYGLPSLTPGTKQLFQASYTPAYSFGAPTLTQGAAQLNLAGKAFPVGYGLQTVAGGATAIFLTGIAYPVGFGAPIVRPTQIVELIGVGLTLQSGLILITYSGVVQPFSHNVPIVFGGLEIFGGAATLRFRGGYIIKPMIVSQPVPPPVNPDMVLH